MNIDFDFHGPSMGSTTLLYICMYIHVYWNACTIFTILDCSSSPASTSVFKRAAEFFSDDDNDDDDEPQKHCAPKRRKHAETSRNQWSAEEEAEIKTLLKKDFKNKKTP